MRWRSMRWSASVRWSKGTWAAVLPGLRAQRRSGRPGCLRAAARCRWLMSESPSAKGRRGAELLLIVRAGLDL